ncbi:MAG TPA: efflux RND transporter permease subunit [Rhizomicrobium sp.]|jgi:multidrug efflux pump|nr:efflux RND transporter permease subunit [Rhizomicrobium sp.]
MTRIVEWAVKNTRLVIAAFVVTIIAGVLAFIAIPKESDPDIPIPYIVVQVDYPGISPEDSERLLVKPMENYLRSIQGLKEMTGRAYQGAGVIIMQFDVSFNKDRALADVRAQVDTARAELPPDVQQPIVQEISTSLFPVISVALSGDVPERTLYHLARDLSDQLKTIPTVLDAQLSGDRAEMLEIVIDPAKLESYGITQQEMFNAITNNNTLIAAGSIDTGHGSFAVKVPGVIESPQDVLNLPIRANADASVTLKDVAQVRPTFYDASSYSTINGKRTIAIDVTKRVGANVIQNNLAVRQLLAQAQKYFPAGVHVSFVGDQSTDIRDQLGSLSDAIILAIILVMIVVVAALGLRSGLLVGVAIPTSFLMSFMVLKSGGYTLNFMIMFAMLLAVGILVDGAIIVVEYADRKMTEGHPPKLAFAEAARRMFWPVVSSTATMVGAFLPMLLWPGIAGEYMSFFPKTLIIVLSSSMIVALIFLPVLGGFFGKAPERNEKHEKAIEASETGDWRDIPGITGWYAHLADWITHNPGKMMGIAAAAVVVVLTLFITHNHGSEFFVQTDPTEATVLVSARGNLAASEKRDLVMSVEKRIESVKGVDYIYANSGGNPSSQNIPVDNIGRITVVLKPYKERARGDTILEEIRKRTADMAGIKVEVRKPEGGPSSGKDVMIDVNSDDYLSLLQTTAKLRKHVDGMSTLRDIEDTRPLPGIEWDLDVKRDVAQRFGVSTQAIGAAVQLVTDGIFVGRYRPADSTRLVDIRVRYPSQDRGIHALDQVRVATADGMVPISTFVQVRAAPQVNTIERVNAHRTYHVRANVKPGLNVNAEVQKIKDWVNTQTFPHTVHVKFRGADEDQQEAGQFLILAAFMALFIIAVVLLAMFNSFYHASLILLAVILAMIGALLGMVVMGQAFSIIMTGTGLLALAGIVVNHNIVLIDTYHKLLDSGMNPIEAVIRSGAQRLRPVFLTTVTAIFGLLPMMAAVEIDFAARTITIGDPFAMMWMQLSTAIVFGLAFSKGITLGLVPALLAYPHRVRETGHGFLWMMGRIFGWPIRAVRNRGRRIPPGAVQQPAE